MPVDGSVGRSCGELGERIRNAHQPTVEGQLAAELVQLVEVIIQSAAALRPQRRAQYALGHKRIAVAITADPAAQPQKGGETRCEPHARARELIFKLGVEPRQSVEKSVIIIRKAIGHLVDHTQPRPAQRIGLPQGQHRAAQRRLVGCELGRGQGRPVAIGDQVGDFDLAINCAPAAHLVGCAVKTGTTMALAKKASTRAGGMPA